MWRETTVRPIQAGDGTRTRDPLFTRQALYQLSYSGATFNLALASRLGACRKRACHSLGSSVGGSELRMSGGFTIEEERQGAGHRLALNGELDLAAAYDLENTLSRVCGEGARVELDL